MKDQNVIVGQPVAVLAQPDRNIVQLRFRLVLVSPPGPEQHQPEIHVGMTLETAALLLAGLKPLEPYLDMTGILDEGTLVPPAKDRN